jgi:predicted phage baseplate assembly protein
VTGTQRISAVLGDEPDHLLINFTPPLPVALDGATAILRGNVAWSTHGETVPEEILGDGDGAAAFQRYTLRKAPLTYLTSAKSPRGEAQLTVLANGEKWTEAESLYGHGPNERIYTARQADDGTTTLQFGNGVTGARLPSGRGNVKATYRQGAGLEGRVRADQLSILLARPPGLKSATNPQPAEGGANAEPLDQARTNAPATVKTFGRAISLPDFESLATASGEVAKAKATWVWRGLEKAVHVSIAGQGGAPFSPESLQLIYASLTSARDPNRTLLLGNVCRVPVRVAATLAVDAAFVRDDVLAAARAALSAFFSFDRMAIARAVHRSDIYAVLQSVTGVLSVDLDHFHFRGAKGWTAGELAARGATSVAVQKHLRIFEARPMAQATLDPAVRECFPSVLPEVLPAEQAHADEADLVITATGGIG